MHHGTPETLCVSEQIFPVIVAVLLHSRQKPRHGLHKSIVVHYGIPLVAHKPVSRISVMLRNDDRIGIGEFDGPSEFFPESVVKFRRMTEVCGHVESPAVRIIGCAHPFAAYFHDVIGQFPAALVIEFGQGVVTPPSVIAGIVRPAVVFVEFEIIPVRAVRRNKSSFFIALLVFVYSFPVEPFVERAAVIEYAVEYDFYSPLVSFGNNFCEKFVAGFKILFVGNAVNVFGGKAVFFLTVLQKFAFVVHDFADMGIDVIVVLNIVFVVGGRHEKRIEINNVDSEILEIVHLVENALQISAVEFADTHLRGIFIPVGNLLAVSVKICVLIGQNVVALVAVVKSVHVNLVHNGAFCPCGSSETCDDTEIVIFLNLSGQTSGIVIAHYLSGKNLKAVSECFFVHGNNAGIIIEHGIHLGFDHLEGFVSRNNVYRIDIVSCGSEFYCDFFFKTRFRRRDIILRGIREESLLVEHRSH